MDLCFQKQAVYPLDYEALPKLNRLFSPYIALISAFAAQMALLGFISPLLISPETCHLMVKDYSRACQRERGKQKEEEVEKSPEKTLRRDRDVNPWTLSPEPSVLAVRLI